MKTNKQLTISVIFFLLAIVQIGTYGQAAMRRPISPSSPMLMVHIDSWNWADPQKIIDLIPTDIRPYVVMNISLSINHSTVKSDGTCEFKTCEYGYETAKSWVRTCAENQMWCMIQPSSGGYSHFVDGDLNVVREFYNNYPNFLGINYAEQFWGFDGDCSGSWLNRVAHWVNLMNLADEYGGYLTVSWCGAYWGSSIDPMAMMKRNSAFASVCASKADHFILCEKYTTSSMFYDMESLCLGTYLSGYSGQYGIRFDQCGWLDASGAATTFPVPAGAAPVIEHVMLTGQTVIDGPELIWQQCIQNLSNGTTSDGYTTRQFGRFQQYDNITIDIFRKVLDGTMRIMTRRQVIDRTKLVMIHDVNSGTDWEKYSTVRALFDGLYLPDGDGTYDGQHYWFKKSGRYPTIPTVYALNGTDPNSFSVKVNQSAYSTRWSATSNKQTEFNSLFPSEYTGTIYAGRNENGWVIYNPLKTGATATGNIPFKYNTCTSMDLTLSQYTSGIMKEVSNKLTIYLNNYDNTNTAFKTDVIKINGCSSQPTYSKTERGSHTASTVTTSYSAGIFTINVSHNGPLDLTVNCSGTATGRLTSYTAATLSAPSSPSVYTGPRQYEAENFDYKNIAGNYTNGVDVLDNYTGQGFLQFGTNSAASIRDYVKVQDAGTYTLATKYSTTGGSVTTIDLYVNGTKVATPTFTATSSYSTWAVNNQTITLNSGTNTIEFRANAAGVRTIYFDNIVVTSNSSTSLTIEENTNGFCSIDGSVLSSNSGYTGTGYADTNSATGAGVSWSVNIPSAGTYTLKWRYASASDRPANLKVDGTVVASNVAFASTGSWTTWVTTGTTSVSLAAGTRVIRLEATTSAGLGNIDNMTITGVSPTAVACSGVKSATTDNVPIMEESSMSLWPNPLIDGALQIKAGINETSDVNITVYNVTGEVVFKKNYGIAEAGLFEQTLDLSNLSKGTYIVRLQANTYIESKLLLIQ
jgi:hypothetical protein